MRKFVMVRNHDAGGVSGTGRVLEGVEFSNGKVVVTWLGKGLSAMSVAVYDSLDDFRAIHVDSHPENKTELLFEEDSTK